MILTNSFEDSQVRWGAAIDSGYDSNGLIIMPVHNDSIGRYPRCVTVFSKSRKDNHKKKGHLCIPHKVSHSSIIIFEEVALDKFVIYKFNNTAASVAGVSELLSKKSFSLRDIEDIVHQINKRK